MVGKDIFKRSLVILPPRDMTNDHEHFEIFLFNFIPVFTVFLIKSVSCFNTTYYLFCPRTSCTIIV